MPRHFPWQWIIPFYVSSLTTTLSAGTLPDGWFVRFVEERSAPDTLSGPVEEKWREQGRLLGVFGDRVLLATTFRSPGAESWLAAVTEGKQPKLTETFRSPRVGGLECRSLQDGRLLWRVMGNREFGGQFTDVACFEDFVLVRVQGPTQKAPATQPAATQPAREIALQQSLWLIDAKNGQVLHRFGLVPEGLDTEARSRPDWRPSADLTWDLLTGDRELWMKTILNPAGPTPPVSGDPAAWTYEQADELAKTLGLLTPRFWAKGMDLSLGLTAPTGEVFYMGLQGRLTARDLVSGKIHWQAPQLVAGPGSPPAYSPPVVVAYTSGSAVTAYDVKTGRPVWTYEWPKAEENYSRGLAALEDGFLLLTEPQVRRPYAMRKVLGGFSTEFTTRPCLVKLDRNGEAAFWQELPLRFAYARMAVGRNAVLLTFDDQWGQSTVVCFGPVQAGKPRTQPARDEERIRRLVSDYERADAMARSGICRDLAELGDTSILDRVLGDMDSAEPQDRSHYVRCLGLLGDSRAIPRLLSFLEMPPRERAMGPGDEVRIALEAITGGDPMRSEVYRQWRDRRIEALRVQLQSVPSSRPHAEPSHRPAAVARRIDQLRAQYPPASTAGERVVIAVQLCELQAPGALDHVLQEFDNAQPRERSLWLRPIEVLRDKRAIPKLLAYLREADPMVRHQVNQTLASILGAGILYKSPEEWDEWWQAHRHLYDRPTGDKATK